MRHIPLDAYCLPKKGPTNIFTGEKLELNGAHQLMVYADDTNLLSENINIIKKNTEALSDARKETGLEENAEKTRYMFMSRHQTQVLLVILRKPEYQYLHSLSRFIRVSFHLPSYPYSCAIL
jgi:hypothetical protein